MATTRNKVRQVAQLYGTKREPNPSGGRVFDPNGIMRTLGGGNGMSKPFIIVRQATKSGYTEICRGGVLSIAYPSSKTRRGRVIDKGNTSPTLDTGSNIGVVDFDGEKVMVRKLTPKECFRLQGFPDEYFERAASVNSDSQLYKQAGNSVTVNVIYEIAKRLK